MAKKEMATKIEMASVLAFEKKIVPSDARMYSALWDTREDKQTPVKLVEKSVRGTISNRMKKADQMDPVKINKEVEKANLQTVDSAAILPSDDTLVVKYSVKILPGAEVPSACNSAEHNELIIEMGQKFKDEFGYGELSKRYATNIANGRFLWRNRVGAEDIIINVSAKQEGKNWTFNAYDYTLGDFTGSDSKLMEMAAFIADTLSGKKDFLLLEVEAYVKIGAGQEIYPSEELVLDKGNSKKSKILYAIEGIAAMHSQKIGNALRTIDTWYPDYTDLGVGPIAIEPYGAVTNLGTAFRKPSDKKDFYTLFDKYSTGNDFENEDDANYVMAVLVRGGVFGQSSKE